MKSIIFPYQRRTKEVVDINEKLLNQYKQAFLQASLLHLETARNEIKNLSAVKLTVRGWSIATTTALLVVTISLSSDGVKDEAFFSLLIYIILAILDYLVSIRQMEMKNIERYIAFQITRAQNHNKPSQFDFRSRYLIQSFNDLKPDSNTYIEPVCKSCIFYNELFVYAVQALLIFLVFTWPRL